jgi:hypothetical protein
MAHKDTIYINPKLSTNSKIVPDETLQRLIKYTGYIKYGIPNGKGTYIENPNRFKIEDGNWKNGMCFYIDTDTDIIPPTPKKKLLQIFKSTDLYKGTFATIQEGPDIVHTVPSGNGHIRIVGHYITPSLYFTNGCATITTPKGKLLIKVDSYENRTTGAFDSSLYIGDFISKTHGGIASYSYSGEGTLKTLNAEFKGEFFEDGTRNGTLVFYKDSVNNQHNNTRCKQMKGEWKVEEGKIIFRGEITYQNTGREIRGQKTRREIPVTKYDEISDDDLNSLHGYQISNTHDVDTIHSNVFSNNTIASFLRDMGLEHTPKSISSTTSSINSEFMHDLHGSREPSLRSIPSNILSPTSSRRTLGSMDWFANNFSRTSPPSSKKTAKKTKRKLESERFDSDSFSLGSLDSNLLSSGSTQQIPKRRKAWGKGGRTRRTKTRTKTS